MTDTCREAFHEWYKDPDGNTRALRRSDTNEDGLRANGKIIQRNGKPFFWPEVEA